MKFFHILICLFLFFYQSESYSYPKIYPIKSNFDYLLITENTLPIIDFAINFNIGSRDDEKMPGLTNLSFELFSKLKYKNEKIVDLFENIGAEFDYYVGKDFSSIQVRFINNSKNIDNVSNLLNFILKNRKVDKNDLQLVKEKIKNRIRAQLLRPGSLASIKSNEKFFIGTAYSHPIIGYKESINLISTVDIIRHLHRTFTKESISINLVGNINETKSAHIISKILSNVPKGQKIKRESSKIKFNGKMYLQKIPMATKQTHISILISAVKRIEEDYYNLLVANYIFGGSGFGSRLFKEIRQKRGLAYSVHSYLRPYDDFGVLIINMQTKNKNVQEAINILKKEVHNFKTNSFNSREIVDAKKGILGNFFIRHDTNKKMLGLLIQINFLNIDLNYFKNYENEIKNVNSRSILNALQKYLLLEKSIITIVGNS